MIVSTHFAVQIRRDIWLVTFVSELGITETRRMTATEFIKVIEDISSIHEPGPP